MFVFFVLFFSKEMSGLREFSCICYKWFYFVALLKLVLANNMEAMVEACRVFANLTRQKVVRDFLTEQKSKSC